MREKIRAAGFNLIGGTLLSCLPALLLVACGTVKDGNPQSAGPADRANDWQLI